MTRRPLRILVLGLTGLALVAASCGDDDESSDDSTEATEATESEDSEADASDDTAADTSDDTEAEESDEPADVSDGGCRVTVTGEVETSWSVDDSNGAVLYGPWVTGVAATALDMDLDATNLIINCSTEGAGISFNGNGSAEIPMEPATYVISGEQGALGGGSELIGAIINLGDLGLYGMAEDGNLTLTEFDEEHIAGTFELPVKEMFGETESEEPTATITGSFNFDNQND